MQSPEVDFIVVANDDRFGSHQLILIEVFDAEEDIILYQRGYRAGCLPLCGLKRRCGNLVGDVCSQETWVRTQQSDTIAAPSGRANGSSQRWFDTMLVVVVVMFKAVFKTM